MSTLRVCWVAILEVLKDFSLHMFRFHFYTSLFLRCGPAYVRVCAHVQGTRRVPEAVLYNELVMTTKQYMREVTVIDLNWLSELVPRYEYSCERGVLLLKSVEHECVAILCLFIFRRYFGGGNHVGTSLKRRNLAK